MQYRKKPVVVDAFQYNGDLRNPDGEYRIPIWAATADVAYFAKGWDEARGCKIENTCAIEYGITVIEDYEKEE